MLLFKRKILLLYCKYTIAAYILSRQYNLACYYNNNFSILIYCQTKCVFTVSLSVKVNDLHMISATNKLNIETEYALFQGNVNLTGDEFYFYLFSYKVDFPESQT